MKSFLQKNLKTIIMISITAIICICGTAFATYKYVASEVEYKDGKSIETALNELYEKNKLIKLGNYRFDTTCWNNNNTQTTFDLSQINNYKNITIDNIYLVMNSLAPAWGAGQSSLDCQWFEKSYNSETGILTITTPYVCYRDAGVWLDLDIYLYQ